MNTGPEKRINAIFFDLGKVLVDFDWDSVLAKLKPDIAVPVRQINEIILCHPYRFDYETGRISTEQFFTWMRRETGYRKSAEELIHAWSDIFRLLPERTKLLPILKKRYYLGMISNTCDAHFRLLKSRHDFFQLFDQLTLSFEAGVMKPDPAIYRIAAESLYVLPQESVFIDDLEENIIAARDLGWHTIHVQPHEALDEILRDRKLL